MARLPELIENLVDRAAWAARRKNFARSEEGSLIIFGLFVFLLILTAGGMAVDLMRFETERTRIQATLDRAVLAAAGITQPLDAKLVVMDYFERAGLGDAITEDDIDAIVSGTTRRVDASATMTVPSIFLNLAGITELEASASAAAQQAATQLEVSLVLDVSGSMNDATAGTTKTRLEVLQDAVAPFVNMLMCDPTDTTKTTNCTVPAGSVAINIVPYSEQVLVGETLMGYLNATSEHTSSSCVTFSGSAFSSTGITDTTFLQRTGHFDAWSGYVTGTSKDDVPNLFTCDPAPWREILAFEDNVGEIQDRILNFEAEGNTSIDLGVKWGAALLDPDFQTVVSEMHDDGLIADVYQDFPLEWDASRANKVLVVMTDGVNTDQNYLFSSKRSGPSKVWRTNDKVSGDYRYSVYYPEYDYYYWPHSGEWKDHAYGTGSTTTTKLVAEYFYPYYYYYWDTVTTPEPGNGAFEMDHTELWARKTWEWYAALPNRGYPGSWVTQTTKNDRLSAICSAAKTAGITIFTIGFDTSTSEETLLKNCASQNAYFFDADGLELETAFEGIGREVSKLQLVN